MKRRNTLPLNKTYLVEVSRRRFIEVFASSEKKAAQYAKDIYESGDACGELEDAKYEVVFQTRED